MNRVLSPSDIDDIEQLRARLIIAEKKLSDKQLLIEKLEQTIADLAQRHWGRSSERHPGQGELSLFNEAELAAMNAPLDEHGEDESESCDSTSGDESEVSNNSAANPPKKTRRKRVLPDHLERVRVTHELDEEHLHGLCGKQRVVIGEEITEQIGVIPAKQFVIQHVKIKYACPCKQCGVLTATMPALPLPGSQASPSVLAYTMVAKFLDGLPLYRQQQMWAREGLELNRAKLARWLIDSSELLQPLYNLMQEMLFSYDIVMSDDTGIHVLKEDGRS